MENKLMKSNLLLIPAFALALTLGGQVYFYMNETPTTELHASWAFKPRNLDEAKDKAENIVEAEVVSVKAGADIITQADGEPNGEDRIPTQVVTLKVLKSHKGKHKAGDSIELFQTGGLRAFEETAGEPPKDQMRVQAQKVILEGDPLYQVGDKHMLMLDQGPRGLQKTIAPQGRFKIEGNGTVTPTVDDEVTRPIKGKALSELQKQVGGK
jgi:hypothetical protein